MFETEYEVTIIRRKPSEETSNRWADITIEKATGRDLIEVLAQFPLLIARIQKKIEEDIKKERGIIFDDSEDVPF